MVAKDRQKSTQSPKALVGEIDTSAPFQSVKDAVNLFGEGAFSGERPTIKKSKAYSAERVLAKETQLHLVQKELNKLQEQVKNAETTKTQALSELEKAKRTVETLTNKLKEVGESKESAVRATELAKQVEGGGSSNSTSNGGSQEVDREQYMAVTAELGAAKQELRKLHQDYDASLNAKTAAINQAAEAEAAQQENKKRADEVVKEIAAVHESVEEVKVEIVQAREEEAKLFADKEVEKQSFRAKLEESVNNLGTLKKQIDPENTRVLETQLAQTAAQVEELRKEMDSSKAVDMDSVKTVTAELDGAKGSLLKVAEEESSMRSLVEELKLELESVKKEHSELNQKEAEKESLAENLQFRLRKAKSELESALAEEAKTKGASDEMISTLNQLLEESELAGNEAEEMTKQALLLKEEVEATRIILKETEEKLKMELSEAEEAKAAEARALAQITALSETTNASRASTSESGAQITLSRDEYESLSKKVEESDRLAEMKVAAAMAQVEAVKASQNEALKKLENTQKEIDEMKAATKEALRKAEQAEAAKKAVEGELRRWREREQKKAEEAASRILAETEMSYAPSSPNYNQIQSQKTPEKRLEKSKTSSVSKKVLMPSLTGIFHKKKNLAEEHGPLSYLPGERNF